MKGLELGIVTEKIPLLAKSENLYQIKNIKRSSFVTWVTELLLLFGYNYVVKRKQIWIDSIITLIKRKENHYGKQSAGR